MKRVFLLIVVVGVIAADPQSALSVLAADATPVANDRPLLAGIEGLEDAAIRAMQIEVIKQSGPIVMTFEVLRFRDEQFAKDNLDEIVARVVARFNADRNGADSYQPMLEAPTIGDETVVYRGEQRYDEPIGSINASPVDILVVRIGVYVHIAVGATMRGEALPDLVAALTITTNRHEGGGATPTNNAGYLTGGLWDLLPTLEDVPSGFAITDEIVPEPIASANRR